MREEKMLFTPKNTTFAVCISKIDFENSCAFQNYKQDKEHISLK
jgi:hypothetical protein